MYSAQCSWRTSKLNTWGTDGAAVSEGIDTPQQRSRPQRRDEREDAALRLAPTSQRRAAPRTASHTSPSTRVISYSGPGDGGPTFLSSELICPISMATLSLFHTQE
ncbi:hypothetical protein EYF80_035898 [Liparis tanakae]|uniref:Uncharacterized protein n=1 Tax=Liparis tanakae TaxID=230148 RepID=A0A4Z2GL32_9TELE|nr:hypothetical protein EYF80_035898 [Liparis tanakae]